MYELEDSEWHKIWGQLVFKERFMFYEARIFAVMFHPSHSLMTRNSNIASHNLEHGRKEAPSEFG
jgi:hypothetical protein